jgi:hypothetical protein
MGHLAGRPDQGASGDDLMVGFLATGTRRTQALDSLFVTGL